MSRYINDDDVEFVDEHKVATLEACRDLKREAERIIRERAKRIVRDAKECETRQ